MSRLSSSASSGVDISTMYSQLSQPCWYPCVRFVAAAGYCSSHTGWTFGRYYSQGRGTKLALELNLDLHVLEKAGMNQTYWCKCIVQEMGQLEPSQTSIWPAWKSNNRIKSSNNGAGEDKRWFWPFSYRTTHELHLETYLESLTFFWDGMDFFFLWEWDLLKIHSIVTLDPEPLRGQEWSHLHLTDYWLSRELGS